MSHIWLPTRDCKVCLLIYLFIYLFLYLLIYLLLIHCKPQLHAAYPVPCLIAQNILSSSMPSACYQPVTGQAQAEEVHVQLLCILIACTCPITVCCCFYDCFQKSCMQPQQQNCDPGSFFKQESHKIRDTSLLLRILKEDLVRAAVVQVTNGQTGVHWCRVNLVLVGAEGVVENGGIINKLGSYHVAIAAKEHRIPFYVAAESYKVKAMLPVQSGLSCKVSSHSYHHTTFFCQTTLHWGARICFRRST